MRNDKERVLDIMEAIELIDKYITRGKEVKTQYNKICQIIF